MLRGYLWGCRGQAPEHGTGAKQHHPSGKKVWPGLAASPSVTICPPSVTMQELWHVGPRIKCRGMGCEKHRPVVLPPCNEGRLLRLSSSSASSLTHPCRPAIALSHPASVIPTLLNIRSSPAHNHNHDFKIQYRVSQKLCTYLFQKLLGHQLIIRVYTERENEDANASCRSSLVIDPEIAGRHSGL